ncbi:class II glutamine amidotransferase [uncultured Roseovarius sp.]|uniref:class II glutamine amidotransferase n=1 Tax=uncultured Roseovarius sp. TaxID=293344 RepID=UPI00262EC0F1|nr:class II glutamine amidotransferase [uncultured Roseovarius sp.]
MCRWAAWVGAPVFLEEIVSRPNHSLIVQSQQADECKTATNADGFGVAWYDQKPEPGLYRDVYPAWSDPNLAAVAAQVKSRLFLAHVRASTGSAISRNNCHPFAVGRWSFMHNGQVGGFETIRKQVDMAVPDHLYSHRKGATDSEAIFLMALGLGLDERPVEAMEEAVLQMQRLSEARGTTPHMRLSVAYSDGTHLYAVRYASDSRAPTLYYRHCERLGGYMVVSEPLISDVQGWVAVPQGAICQFAADGVEQRAFLQETTHGRAA